MAKNSLESTVILVVFLAAVLWSLGVASFGWSHAISDAYGWRQTQTAITAYFMQQGGPWLNYETPVLGPPWALPHEFPVYQLVVAALANTTGLQLEAAGRAVSLGFFYATLAVAYLLFAELGVSPRHRLLVLSFWLVSPLYLFWSRTFMIESTALFLSLAFLTFGGRFFARGRHLDLVTAVLAGGFAFAVKPPTVMVFAGLAVLWWFVLQRRRGYHLTPALLGAFVIVLPLVAGWTWHRHADALKRLNTFGWAWTSDAMWRDWVLGPSGVRSQISEWQLLWVRTVPETVGHVTVVAAAALGILVAGRLRAVFLLALAAFVGHFAAFLHLHLSHAYYAYGMGVFLLAAVGFSAVALLECGDARRYLGWVLAVLVATLCLDGYLTRMLPIQLRNAYRKPAWFVRLAEALAQVTRPRDVIVGFGLNWNPEVPYYARRRALMWPGWGDPSPDGKDVAKVLASLEGYTVGALFTCSPDTPEPTLARMRERWGLADSPTHELPSGSPWRRCVVFARRPAGSVPPG